MVVDLNMVKAAVRRWADGHRHAVLYDEEDGLLLDVASGKATRVSWANVSAFEDKIHPETNDAYLVLLLDNGSQIALADPGGIAFAPSTVNSGPVQGLPPVVCLKDFFTLKARVDHFLYDHPDEAPPRECLDMIMVCIATLDGARAVGFDVGDLEGELEKSLNDIEKRTR
jgi:hypothetical protein